MANRLQLQTTLQKPYDRLLFGKEVLSPVFGTCLILKNSVLPASVQPNKSEQSIIQSVSIYGNIQLEDGTEISCYEIILQPSVKIEYSKVAIQRYVRKMLTAGQIALVNFIAPKNTKVWRFTLIAKDSELTAKGIQEKVTHAKRYTYLLGPSETCKTAAERFEALSTEKEITFQALVNAFSVEKMSEAFFDEYYEHYQSFVSYFTGIRQIRSGKSQIKEVTVSKPSNLYTSVFKKDPKAVRDFVKKLLGRIVFLYFVQKKGWLGSSDTQYKDGQLDFIKQLLIQSGANKSFYPDWLSKLFFETLNLPRNNDEFKMPNGQKVKVPFLNGGLFDKDKFDDAILPIPSKLFHHPDFEDSLLTEKNKENARGFLDFLDAFNFTVYEDSPDDHTVAVDPEMLGHIFENLLEDNKDKGAFYTPKEIVHYMCQESLTEYLTTHLSKDYTVYKELGNQQIELFGNETRIGQLKIIEQLGDKALNREDVSIIVKYKDIKQLTKGQLKKIDTLLDTVKICDPAIGSGAFPMGLLQEIHAIKEVLAYELQYPWKPAEVKENIIQNSIYGVDIEKGAVDIARLRFWLSLVVDEEKPRALPNLDYKIVVGDSLVSKFEGEIIEIDWERKKHTTGSKHMVDNIQRLLKEIAEKQKLFFKPENKNKKTLQAEIRQLKIELLINQLSFNKEKFLSSTTEKGGFAPSNSDLRYNEDLKQKKKDFDRHISKLQKLKQNKEEPFEHFDWKLDFPEVLNPYLVNGNAGFDIVIGNPPYIEFKKLATESKANFGKYKSASRKYDIFCLFIELSSWIAKNEGVHCFINPTTFLMKDFGIPLRDLIKNNFKIIEIFDFADYQIFETAITYTGIFVFKKLKDATDYTFYYQKLNSKEKANTRELLFIDKESSKFKEVSSIEFKKLQEDSWIFGSESSSEILSLIEKDKPRLKEFTKYIFVGIQSGKDEVFFVDSETIREHKIEKQIIFPILKGKDVRKYSIDWGGTYIIYPYDKKTNSVIEEKQFKSQFPNTYKYLSDNRNNLRGRAYFDKSSKNWYELWCERNLAKFMETKIVNAEISPENRFQIDYSGILGNTKIFSTVLKKEWREFYLTLLAILNSSLMNYYHKKIASPKAGGFYDYKTQFIQTYPIVLPKNKDKFDRLVSYVIVLKSQSLSDITFQLMPTYFEKIIDGMVYELYFPELIKKHKREIIQYLGDLPEITNKMSDEQKIKICKSVFNRLNDPKLKVKINLEKMKEEIKEIRIIEGLEND